MNRFRVAIIDQSRLFREGLQQLLRLSKFTVVESGKAFEDINLEPGPGLPDIIVYGFDIVADPDEQFRRASAARVDSSSPRMVVLTSIVDRTFVLRAAAARVDAVLSKDISGEVFQRSLELVMLGQQMFPPVASNSTVPPGTDLASVTLVPMLTEGVECPNIGRAITGPIRSNLASPLALDLAVSGRARMRFSEREDQILRRLAAGASNKVIARDLGITEGTVKVHVKSLCRKLGATNRTQAAIRGAPRIGLSVEEP